MFIITFPSQPTNICKQTNRAEKLRQTTNICIHQSTNTYRGKKVTRIFNFRQMEKPQKPKGKVFFQGGTFPG